MKQLNSIQIRKESYECSITADIAVFGFQDKRLKILLVKKLIEPFGGLWTLPGGALFAGETIEDCVVKVLYALTNIRGIHYQQVKFFSSVDRHPVKRVVTVLFYALIKPENHPVRVKDLVSEIKWFAMDEIPESLGFDHEQLLQEAYLHLQKNLKESLIFGELLPDKFTLFELQTLYESILNESLDRRNFRKKILKMNILESTGEKKKGVQGSPFLYKIKNG